jgi:phage shock protein PspC (stress-responsive transcriptional regulator)
MELPMELEMQTPVQSAEPYVALPLRSHTILGVCEGLGEDFGISPLFFRVPLAAMVLWSPLIAFGLYFALGAVVLGSRMLFPRPKSAQTSVEVVTTPQVENREHLPLAA